MSIASTPFTLEKFTSIDGMTSYTFPTRGYQLGANQALRTSFQNIIGADYAVDLLGESLAPKATGIDSHRVMIVEANGNAVNDELDTMRHDLFSIGLGKLFIANSDGDERWAYARLTSMPQTTWAVGNFNYIAAILDWTILSDFYDATPYSEEFSITDDPQTITVPNDGNARVYNAVFTLKGPYSSPEVANLTTGYTVDINRIATDNTNWLQIDAGQGVVLFSEDSGATYFGDFENVTLPTQQIQLIVLAPGDNSIQLAGLGGGSVLVEFSPAFD